MRDRQGFLLIEVLLAILIISVAFTASAGVLRQALMISEKTIQTTEAISAYENLQFELDAGTRPDLVAYGGKGPLANKYRYSLEPLAEDESFFWTKSRILSGSGKDLLSHDLFLSEAPVQ